MKFELDHIYHAKQEGIEVLVQASGYIGRNFEYNFIVLAVFREEDKEYLNRFVTVGGDCNIEEVFPKNLPLYISWSTSPKYSRLLRDS